MRYTDPPSSKPRRRSKGSPQPSTSKAAQRPRRKAQKKGKRRNTSLESVDRGLPLKTRKAYYEPVEQPVEAKSPETEDVPPEQDAGMDNPLESGMADLDLSPAAANSSGN